MLQHREEGMLKSERKLEEKGKMLEERDEALRKREGFLLDIEKSIHAIIDLFEVRMPLAHYIISSYHLVLPKELSC